MARAPLPPEVIRAASEMQQAPVVIKRRLIRPDLVHCVVRPRFRPRGAVRSTWSQRGQGESGGPEAAGGAEHGEAGCGLDLGYELDEYQQLAGKALEEAESVVVSAPTTSGKTTVALLALGLALRKPGRSVFCAPIKALSNQMFSEFHATFPGKVGLLTGDHCIGHESPILVMTTEIFRCLLQNDADFVLNLRTAIFDEVHFLSDAERGPTWEECITLLPPGVPIVCLSATMSNPLVLAGWLAQIKCSPAHAIQKKGRPVPLRHVVHPIGGDPGRPLEVLDADGRVHPCQIDLAARQVEMWHGWWQQKQQHKRERQKKEQAEREQHGQQPRDKRKEKNETYFRKQLLDQERMSSLRKLLACIQQSGQKPVLVFCFSKPACDQLAEYLLSSQGIMSSNAASTSGRDAEIRKVIQSELRDLPQEVKPVEQVEWATEHLLPRSIGVHHAGMVPVLRELTEILFKRGLLDVLVCTETFGMGLNMPARTVVFNFRPEMPLKKFDGTGQRVLTPTEYMQMSGRAGRRKQDTNGTAVLALNDPFQRQDLCEMLGRQNPEVRSNYEMQVASALHCLRHGRGFMEWFSQQTLLQFESQGCDESVLGEHLDKLMFVLRQEELDLTDATGRLTERGRAICGMNCGDVLILGKLLADGCFDGVEPVDLLAYLTVFILDRPPPKRCIQEPLTGDLADLSELCLERAAAVDAVLAEAQVQRQCDGDCWIREHLQERTYMIMPLRSTWLSGSSFDEAARACYDQCQQDAGTLVRIIRRLDECSTEVMMAAKRLKNPGVAAALATARKQLRRGLPFMDSLYFPKELRDRENELVAGLAPPEDEADVDCWASDHAAGQRVLLDPCAIGFSHNSVAMNFMDGTPLRTKLWRLLRQEENVDEFASSMRVVFYRGRPYTLGNRRLTVLRMYSWMLPEGTQEENRQFSFPVVSQQEALDWGWDRKFTTGCFRGARVVIRETGEVVGISRHDSLCTLEEEQGSIEEEWEDGAPEAGGGAADSGPGGARSFWAQYQDLPTELREVNAEDQAEDLQEGAPEPSAAERGAQELRLSEVLGAGLPAGPRLPELARPAPWEELQVPERKELVFTSQPFGMKPCKRSDTVGYVVASVSDMKPAARGGVLPGWRLVCVAGQATSDLCLEDVQQLLKAAQAPVQVVFEDVPANGMFCSTCQKILLARCFPQGMRRRPADKRQCEECRQQVQAEGDAAVPGTA